jgi:hypothetical protein
MRSGPPDRATRRAVSGAHDESHANDGHEGASHDHASHDHASHDEVASRAEILTELALLLRAALALDDWGRLQIELVDDPRRGLVVSDVVVEEIVGDEARVDAAFNAPDAGAMMPTLARAIEALAALDGLDAAELGGGTFVRVDEAPGLAFLPGRVRAPSRALDQRREPLLAALRAKELALKERAGVHAGAALGLDLEGQAITIREEGVVRSRGAVVVLGSFSWQRRSWAWAAHNPSAPEGARARSKQALDAVRDRSLWEIATPGFQTDEAGAWLLAALLVEENALDGAVRVELGDEGFLLVGLRDLVAAG